MNHKFSKTITNWAVSLLAGIFVISATGEDEFLLEEIADGVFVHYGLHEQITFENKGDIANIGFIVGEQAVAVIDTGGSKYVGEALKRRITQTTNLPIRYVILTHVHPDHVFGVKAFDTDEYDVEIVGHKKLTEALIQRGEFYQQRFINEQGFLASDLALMPQTIFVDTIEKIDLGGRVLTLMAHQTSHTNNDLTVYDEKTKTLWTGDLLFRERVPVVDGTTLGWVDTMSQLSNIEVNYIIPGHGFVSRSWAEATADQQRYLAKLITGVRQNIKDGKSINHSIDTVGLDENEKWKLFGDHHGQNVSRTYVELEWE